MQSNTALIVGANGQDGTILSQKLRARGQKLLLVNRHSLTDAFGRESSFSVLNRSDVENLIRSESPQEVYYLAAHHHSAEGSSGVHNDDNQYDLSRQVHVEGIHNILEAAKSLNRKMRIFYASSALIFDGTGLKTQSERTLPKPICYYGLTKLEGQYLCEFYRDAFDLFVSVGILYSHESHLRPGNYFSQKVLTYLLSFRDGGVRKLRIGDLNASNDWGYAPIYVDAFTQMLEAPYPGTYIVSSGRESRVVDFLDVAFKRFGLSYQDHIEIDPSILNRKPRSRIGNPRKIKLEIGWEAKLSLSDLIEKLIEDRSTL